MTNVDASWNRRRYPRVHAPAFCTAARFRAARWPVIDIGLEGVRIYSDEQFRVGERLHLELYLPEDKNVVFTVRVVWLSPLPAGSPARYDVGLQLLDAKGDGFQQLAGVLEGHA